MADLRRPSPSELNCDDLQFPQQITVWASWAQREINESIAGATTAIAESRELLAEADRVLARR